VLTLRHPKKSPKKIEAKIEFGYISWWNLWNKSYPHVVQRPLHRHHSRSKEVITSCLCVYLMYLKWKIRQRFKMMLVMSRSNESTTHTHTMYTPTNVAFLLPSWLTFRRAQPKMERNSSKRIQKCTLKQRFQPTIAVFGVWRHMRLDTWEDTQLGFYSSTIYLLCLYFYYYTALSSIEQIIESIMSIYYWMRYIMQLHEMNNSSITTPHHHQQSYYNLYTW